MNICPICDSQIEGTWCKHCFRFVKPLEIPNGIHLNEGHDLKHETDCEYHDTADLNRRPNTVDLSGKPDSKYKQQIEERRRQMEARQNAGKAVTTQAPAAPVKKKDDVAKERRQQKAVRKRKRGSAFFVWLAIFVVIAGVIYNSNRQFFHEAWDVIQQVRDGEWDAADLEKYFPGIVESVQDASEASPVIAVDKVNEAVSEYYDEVAGFSPAAAVLRKLDPVATPVESYVVGQENGYDIMVYVYDYADIARLSFGCDSPHFEKTYQDILDKIHSGNTVFYLNDIEEVPSGAQCYLFDAGEYAYANFSEYYQLTGNDVQILVDVDVVTKQVHRIEVVSEDLDSIGFQVAAYEFLDEFMPAYYQGLGAMTEAFKESAASGDLIQAETGECSFIFMSNGTGFHSLAITPVE